MRSISRLDKKGVGVIWGLGKNKWLVVNNFMHMRLKRPNCLIDVKYRKFPHLMTQFSAFCQPWVIFLLQIRGSP
jgi:hypothetical protein